MDHEFDEKEAHCLRSCLNYTKWLPLYEITLEEKEAPDCGLEALTGAAVLNLILEKIFLSSSCLTRAVVGSYG